MAKFSPPTTDEVPTVDVTDYRNSIPWPNSPVEFRLFGHFVNGARARGRTLLLLTDDSVVDLGTFPGQNQNFDPSLGNGDVFTEQGLGSYMYQDLSVAGFDKGQGPSPNGTIKRVFLGGHIYDISPAEVTALTNAGYGSGIS